MMNFIDACGGLIFGNQVESTGLKSGLLVLFCVVSALRIID